MATRYIALLRGINVGAHQVKMERLRSLFEELGLRNVSSYINSGNVFFDSDDKDRDMLADRLEQHLASALGFSVPVFLRTQTEIEDILSLDPFKGIELTDDRRFCVIFTKQPLDTKLKLPLHSTRNDMDLVTMRPYEAFVVWYIINGRPPSGKFPVDILPPTNTTRFFHTLAKILYASKK